MNGMIQGNAAGMSPTAISALSGTRAARRRHRAARFLNPVGREVDRQAGERRYRFFVPVAVLLPIVLYYFFTKIAAIPIPLGFFEFIEF